MAQICLWTKIRTKQWFVLCASAFQSMCAGFLCSKCDNFVCLHTRQDQNELDLKRWFFFAKIGIFCKSITIPLPSVVQAYTQPYLFGERLKLIICQIRHELSVAIHEISTSWKKRYMADPIEVQNMKKIKWHSFSTFAIAWTYNCCMYDGFNINLTNCIQLSSIIFLCVDKVFKIRKKSLNPDLSL